MYLIFSAWWSSKPLSLYISDSIRLTSTEHGDVWYQANSLKKKIQEEEGRLKDHQKMLPRSDGDRISIWVDGEREGEGKEEFFKSFELKS